MGEEKRPEEPVLDTSFDVAVAPRTSDEPAEGISIFNLSGGILRPTVKTANRIDGLLTKMMAQPGAAQYLVGIDKNLDYLFTSLQLDMINMVAESSSETQEPETSDEAPVKVKLELGPPIHDDAHES